MRSKINAQCHSNRIGELGELVQAGRVVPEVVECVCAKREASRKNCRLCEKVHHKLL
jgi:NAD-dependent DNA ligase